MKRPVMPSWVGQPEPANRAMEARARSMDGNEIARVLGRGGLDAPWRAALRREFYRRIDLILAEVDAKEAT